MAGLLVGKAIVVTGAGNGLGRAYALAASMAGASVVVNDIDETRAAAVCQEITGAGGAAAVSTASVSDWDAAASIVQTCLDEFGSLDGFVNNAAVMHVSLTVDETGPALRGIVEVNVLGVLNCGTHAMRQMCRQRHGSIVNVTSGGMHGAPAMGAYGATKGAVTAATYSWDLEARVHNVRVNAVSPLARTDMWQRWRHEVLDPDKRAEASAPEPAEIAPLVIFLLSDQANGISGQVIRLDGDGLSIVRKAARSDDIPGRSWTAEKIEDAYAMLAPGWRRCLPQAATDLPGRRQIPAQHLKGTP
jgi:NAD(P)-dependent dehydrogenase (short-subunit alcohol dehydrogenase family)